MKFVLRGFLSLCFISLFSVTKQAIVEEPCAHFEISPMENFDARKYLGNWFVYRLYDYAETVGQDCIRWVYNNMTSDETSYVFESSTDLSTGNKTYIHSSMVFHQEGLGQYTYEMEEGTYEPEIVIIISTDYYTYSVEWSCAEIETGTECYVYVIIRNTKPTKDTIDKIDSVLKEHKINTRLARYVEQGPECRHYKSN